MRVYLARHGETTWNVAGRYQGRMESPLSPLGERQARALAGAMRERRLARVVSSPLGRCTATAAPAARAASLPLETDERLIEIAHGTWEGRLRDELAANDAQRYRAWRGDPAHVAFDGGESLADVLARWRAFAVALTGDAARTHGDPPQAGASHGGAPHGGALVVTHDAVVRVALVDARGAGLDAFWNARVENGAYAVFDVDARGWTLIDECVTAHLGALRADVSEQAL